ncbi:MAG: TlpA family protein disulfide reductase [Planctomycetota bacterium]|jgi:hypothetical protein
MDIRKITPLTGIGLVLFAATLPAQVGKGETAPEFEIKAALNQAPAKFQEFRGKVLMLDFFATW